MMDSPPRPLARLLGAAQRRRLAMLALLMIGSALTEGLGIMLLVPLLAAITPGQGGAVSAWLADRGLQPSLGQVLTLFVLLVLLRAVINQARNGAALKLEITVVDGLRQRAWRALLQADWRTLAAMRRSDSASVLISHIDRAGFGINQLGAAVASLITLAGLGLAGLAVAPAMALGGTLGAGLILLAYAGMRRRAAGLGEELSNAYRTMHASISESLDALRTVKSLQGEVRAEQAAFAGFTTLGRARIDYQRDLGLGQILLHGGGAAGLALLVWLAFARWNLAATQVLPLVALAGRVLPLIGQLQESWQNYAYARPAIGAAFALIDQAEAAREPDLPHAEPPQPDRTIRLEKVTVQFANQSEPVLDQVDLEIPRGAIIALTGASGTGKSTLADVLSALIAPDTGHIAIDGTALDAAQARAWRARVAYVQQDPALLADSVRANLLWAAPDADEARLRAALADAACQFVDDLPQGLDTRIGDGGRVLSGGERQRLMLARALLRDPALLILDEATSALDTANEAQIAAALRALKGRMTILLIAHRGLLTDLADRTYRIEGGKLIS